MSEPRSLPPRPDLRHLRDEAKRRRKAGEFTSLALAQLAIAREHGFRSWPRLKFHIEALTLDASKRAAALIASATSPDLRRARALLAADPALARHDLACACATGEADEVSRRLAVQPALVKEPTGPNGWAPILYACFSRLLRGDPGRAPGIREVVRRLLAAGADPNAWFVNDDQWLQVALYGAAGIAGDPELTRMLLEAGADPTDEREERDGYHGNEVLYHACEFPDPTCARLVIEAGSRQDLIDYNLGRALNFANPEMVEMFCTHGARADAGHLHQAVWSRRDRRTVAALLDAGAPINARDGHGLSALRVAVRWGEEAVAELLRERGADGASITTEDRAIGRYLSGAATELPRDVDLSLLDEMLILAIQGGHLDAVRRLLDAGARVDGDPDSDDVPLGQACWRGRVQMTRELVSRGAALTFRDGGSAMGAALHGSRHCNDPEGGPTMQIVDEIPKEPYAEIVRLLLAAGAAVPQKVGDAGERGTMLLAELGVDPPA
jgi:ankyrin repeat protein